MELRFGHRVLAWDYDEEDAVLGRYICEFSSMDRSHAVLHGDTNRNSLECFLNVKLDPNATEFLPGDRVEASEGTGDWFYSVYVGFDVARNSHGVKLASGIEWFVYCRYPRNAGTIEDRVKRLEKEIEQRKKEL